jgi:Na+-translocating ferredoxin:NAD+ oxidoreductase RNF subunit RnfB
VAVSNVILAAGIMGGLALFFGVVLAVAYRLLRVDEDPRIDAVEAMLPATNCGACGQPGCRAFAEALVSGRATPGSCTVSSPDGVAAIAEYLGVDAGEQVKRVARLHCAGGRAQALQIAAYDGYESCRAAHLVGAGGKGCSWGCLGLGDCERACDFDAIHMDANGLPVVAVTPCTACGDCVEVCPRDLFEILPLDRPLLVQCRVPLAAEEARALCSVACDACGRCVQDAPPGLIEMVGNLPVIDYASGPRGGPEATFRCPTRAIRWVPGGQFGHDEPEPTGASHGTLRSHPS